MSIKNFKNPWDVGGEFYPKHLEGKEVLGKSVISDDSETYQDEEEKDNYDFIDVIISKSSIQGVQQMNFVKTHLSPKNNPSLRVRYVDHNGKVNWTGENFKRGSLEYTLFNKEGTYYNTKNANGGASPTIILEGTAKTPKLDVKFWVAWNRYKVIGEIDVNAPTREPNGRPFQRAFANTVQPNSLFFFTAYFENHSVTKITNQVEVNRIIQDIYNTFENDGRLKVHAVNADLSVRQVGFMIVGYHAPEPTNNTGLNNTELALGRSKTVQKLLLQKVSAINITAIGAISGGDSQEFGVRPAITYFGAKAFIDTLGIPYTPPTIGE